MNPKNELVNTCVIGAFFAFSNKKEFCYETLQVVTEKCMGQSSNVSSVFDFIYSVDVLAKLLPNGKVFYVFSNQDKRWFADQPLLSCRKSEMLQLLAKLEAGKIAFFTDKKLSCIFLFYQIETRRFMLNSKTLESELVISVTQVAKQLSDEGELTLFG